MNTLTVRQANFCDLDPLADLFNQYRQFQGRPSDPAAAREFLRARFDHGESVAFLAFVGAQPMGFAQLFPSWSSTALARVFVLNDLFVHASSRRAGVATGLLAAVERYAWGQGAVRLSLNVAHDNTTGQALYAAKGWTRDAQFFAYHRVPAAAPVGHQADGQPSKS